MARVVLAVPPARQRSRYPYRGAMRFRPFRGTPTLPAATVLLVKTLLVSLETLRTDIVLPPNDLSMRADEVPEHRVAIDDCEERAVIVIAAEVH